MGWIGQAWRGEERLWKVFWIYGIVFGIVIHFVGIFFKGASAVAGPSPSIQIIGYTLYFLYEIWILVAQWRCAFNASAAFWGYVVRVLVVLRLLAEVVVWVSAVLVEGLLSTNLPQHGFHLAQCVKKMNEYAVQKGIDPFQYQAQNSAYMQQCAKYLDENDKDAKAHMLESTNPNSPYYIGNMGIPDKTRK